MESDKSLQFSELKFIELIRKNLWYGQEYGRTAVMIGSGFSRNADKISKRTPQFPLWDDLGEIFFRSLYPKSSLSDEDYQTLRTQIKKEKRTEQLAQDYEKDFGRTALDDLLIHSVPDNNYTPGYLHRLLLSLPWSDIFTTNYDTLLERTLPKIYDRKYDIVLTKEDLPQKQKPRIVKLHGSLPSHRPFIITHDDYEKYPSDFAPFTNMVQEAIMENTFCLIGFSGDDQNFLKWSEWVEKNLGKSTPLIYLCGILDLSMTENKNFRKNIVPIDFAHLFPKKRWPDSDIRHKCALEWFLLTLMEGAPPNKNRWPTISKITRKPKCPHIPSIPQGPPSLPDLGKWRPPTEILSNQDIIDISSKWQRQRNEYPGWIILPEDNRENVWEFTKNWINPILNSLEKIQPPNDIFVLFELNWRLQLLAIPLFSNWLPHFEKIVISYNPFPSITQINESVIRPDTEQYKDLDWKKIGDCWIEIIFSLAGESRRDHKEENFKKWMHLIENVVKQKDDWQLTWYFENSQYYLNILDQEALKKILPLWPKSENSPFFDIQKAAIVAELGEFDEAKKITENALEKIRSHLVPNPLDYSVLSQESWAMVLHRNLTTMEKFREGINPVEDRDRWERLAVYRCNPWPEIEKLQLLIQKPKSDPSQNNIKTWSFDPGRITVSHRFGMSSKIEEMFPSLSFLQLFEKAALPMTCGNMNIFSDDVIRASKQIIRYYPISGIISMIRTGKEKEVKEWFDRPRLAVMSSDQINYLSNIFLRSFKQSLNHLLKCRWPDKYNEPDFSYHNIKILSEILSRFCFRFSNEQIGDLFDLTVQMYNSPIFYKDVALYDCLSNLFNRTLFNMPESMLFEKIPILLNLPIPTEKEYNPSIVKHWIEPALLFEWKEKEKMPSDFDRAKWDFPINNLIRITKEGTPEGRERAIARLEKINDIQGLTETEKKLFAMALWDRIDPVSNLPSDLPFYRFSVLSMPDVERGNGKIKFRKYLSSLEIPHVIRREKRDDGKITRSTGGMSEFLEYAANWKGSTLSTHSGSTSLKEILIDWDASEIISLFKKIKNRWDEEKTDFQSELKEIPFASSFFRENIEAEISELISLLGFVILPKISAIEDKECQKEITRLIDDMDKYGACVLSILPLILLIDQNRFDNIAHKLRMGLLSSKEIEAESAIFGITVWVRNAENKKIPPIPRDLLTELMNKVVTRRQPGLFHAIHAVNEIIKIKPQLLENEQNRSSICEALEYLFKDTEIPLDQSDEKREQYKTAVPFNALPHFRELSAILAYTLFKYFESNKKTIPDILLKWKEVSQTDTLPEVRSAWG